MTRLDRSTWPEIGRAAETAAVLLVPIGSTEQHGPHLPVTTDTDVAESIAAAAAGRHDALVVAPALCYTASGEHEGFAGTLSIGQDAAEAVFLELGRSASRDFAHTVLVSTHGGNREPLGRALVRLCAEGHPVSGWWPAWPGDLHAGRTETSLMLAIAPERVHLDRAEPGDCRPAGAVLAELRARGTRAVTANGVLGDPAGASAAEGRGLLEVAVDDLVRHVMTHVTAPTGAVMAPTGAVTAPTGAVTAPTGAPPALPGREGPG